MSLLVAKLQEELPLNFTQIKLQNVLKTLDACVLEKKELENQENLFIIKDHHSIELLLNLWHKVEISQTKMELVVNQFMERNSQMKTSLKSILKEEICQWLILDQTPTDLNSSWLSSHVTGLMENIPSLDKLLMDGQFSMPLSQLVHKVDKPELHAWLQTAVNCLESRNISN